MATDGPLLIGPPAARRAAATDARHSGPEGDAARRAVVRSARVAGALWLVVVGVGGFAVFAQSAPIVRGDAAATAVRLVAAEPLYRLGFAANVVAGACYLAVTTLLYTLLRRAGPGTARVAAACGLVGVATGTAASLASLVPLLLLHGAGDAGAAAARVFTPGQLQVLAYAALRLDAQGYSLGMTFFGVQCVLMGALIVRSALVPRALGVLLSAGGAIYVINSLVSFAAPALARYTSPVVAPAAALGEGALALWLLVRGVRRA